MSEAYKIVTYTTIGAVLSYLAYLLGSQFISTFSESFISLLTTLLAINIASSSLIAVRLNEISKQSGHKFENTTRELKSSLKIQVILIGVAFVVLLVADSPVIAQRVGDDILTGIQNTLTVGIFIYYLDSLWDIGQALFALISFDKSKP
jgi:hypothetical protein